MHQYAYGMTYAKKHNIPFVLASRWEGVKLFKDHNNLFLSSEMQMELYDVREEKNL